MRILWLSHLIPYPPKAGVLQRSYYLLKELSKHHEIDLMAFNQEDLLLSFYDNIDNAISDSRNNLLKLLNQVKFYDIPSEQASLGKYGLAIKSFFNSTGYTMSWLKSKEFENNLKQRLSENKYDLIHFDTISLATYLKSVTDTPASLDHHNIESHMLERRARKESNILKKYYFYQEAKKLCLQEKEYCKKFQLNITCSDMDTERLLDIVGNVKCTTITNGVDVDFFKPLGGVRKNKSLIFIGTMNWYPNIEAVEFLINEVWPEVKILNPDATLNIIGAHPPEHIKKYDGYNNIKIHGFIDDIRPLFDVAHLYICPIKDGGGTKLKILDALAMGKAIIADPIACEGINVINDENVVLCKTKDEFIKNIDELFSNDLKVTNLEISARKLAEQVYKFSNIGEKLSNELEKVHKLFVIKQ